MISHEYRCIFIHIPRCAGSSVEAWISGQDWWHVDPSTKHRLASQTRRIYADYWEDYFKFAIVRNPYTRMLSCVKQYGGHFGLDEIDGDISFAGYVDRFGSDIVIEHDHRFTDRANLLRPSHRPGSIYGNMLDEELDYIASYENLNHDMAIVGEAISHPRPFDCHLERSMREISVNEAGRFASWVRRLYSNDFADYGYPLQYARRFDKPAFAGSGAAALRQQA